MTLQEFLQKDDNAALKRIAELMAVNRGSLAVKQIGPAKPTKDHRYGRYNLNPNEAMELAFLGGFVQGLIAAFDDPHLVEVFQDTVQKEITGNTILIASPEQTKELLSVSNRLAR
jgi:hypothetical protein